MTPLQSLSTSLVFCPSLHAHSMHTACTQVCYSQLQKQAGELALEWPRLSGQIVWVDKTKWHQIANLHKLLIVLRVKEFLPKMIFLELVYINKNAMWCNYKDNFCIEVLVWPKESNTYHKVGKMSMILWVLFIDIHCFIDSFILSQSCKFTG